MNGDRVNRQSQEFQAGYAVGHIDGYEKSRADGWISVKERLPEINGWYLCIIPKPYKTDMCYEIYPYRDGEWNPGKASWINTITHWMPLPQSPQE
jgi:hypothetical protein